ncbi:hypothetical protein B0J18DRAFT_411097 [Chaetomium sp. MPI-SDFR-AT-0129]|nr:hypothetical protein B0J18DRAFT_411097 [Chaetomium sp. MPI-SDFR-AT-0129]
MPSHTSESPAKKQSKWSPEEDALIIELRGSGMKWDDISKRLPGRSSISCRLHYQNYLERRSEWDEERKNKLARLYERFKPEMWAKVAEEMQVPWRAAEAMHWQLGETEMARRAGVVPFSLNMAANEAQAAITQRISPTRAGHSGHSYAHGHSQSQGSFPREFSGLPSPRYARAQSGPHPGPPPLQIPPLIPPPTPTSSSRPHTSRRESLPPHARFGPPTISELPPAPPPPEYGYGLAPIQTAVGFGSGAHTRGSTSAGGGSAGGSISGRSDGPLPSVAELTTGVCASPYGTPAYTLNPPPSAAGSGGHSYPHAHGHARSQSHSHILQSTMPTTSPSSATASPGLPGTSLGGGREAISADAPNPRRGGSVSAGGGGLLPALNPYPHSHAHLEPTGGKRRASPPDYDYPGGSRETSRRRQHLNHSTTTSNGHSYGHSHSHSLSGAGSSSVARDRRHRRDGDRERLQHNSWDSSRDTDDYPPTPPHPVQLPLPPLSQSYYPSHSSHFPSSAASAAAGGPPHAAAAGAFGGMGNGGVGVGVGVGRRESRGGL